MHLPSGLLGPVEAALARHVGRAVKLLGTAAVGGGSIHRAQRLDTDAGPFFLKSNNTPDAADNFAAEWDGLTTLQGRSSLRVPAPIARGLDGGQAWLLMAWLPSLPQRADTWTRLGEGLAALHRHTQAQHGHSRDNYIGSLPQSNPASPNWATFFAEQRLQPQARLAARRGLWDAQLQARLDHLCARLPALLPGEPPALLHGDLWSGNVLPCTGPEGHPAIFDPAVYYGHREMDIAMTRLFGGFDPGFYAAYHAAYPLEPGWEGRCGLHNLYPLMVHLNLFGAGYLPEIQSVLRRYA
jgi:protein-ribulosamine 3-kinase